MQKTPAYKDRASWALHNSKLSRADLLYALAEHGKEHLGETAKKMGFVLKQPSLEEDQKQAKITNTSAETQPPGNTKKIKPKQQERPAAPFYRVVRYEKISHESVETLGDEPPVYFQQVTEPLDENWQPDENDKAPNRKPLCKWSRLWPFLKAQLSQCYPSTQLDIEKITHCLSHGQLPQPLPQKQFSTWSKELRIIIDYNPHLNGLHFDFNDFRDHLLSLRGQAGVSVYSLQGDINKKKLEGTNGSGKYIAWKKPNPQTPILILSDLGLLEQTQYAQKAWKRFGIELKKEACKPLVLMPVHRDNLSHQLQSYYQQITWDQTTRYLRELNRRIQKNNKQDLQDSTALQGIDKLLALCSIATRVEIALLRDFRLLLHAEGVNVQDEASIWIHPDVAKSTMAVAINSQKARQYYHEVFQNTLSEHIQKKVFQLLEKHHKNSLPQLHDEEILLLETLSKAPSPALQKAAKKAKYRMVQFAKAYHQQKQNEDKADYAQRLEMRLHINSYQSTPAYAAIWCANHEDALKKGTIDNFPQGIQLSDIQYFLGKTQEQTHYQLVQQGNALYLHPDDEWQQIGKHTSPLAILSLSSKQLACEQVKTVDVPQTQSQLFDLNQTPSKIPLKQTRIIRLKSLTEQWDIQRFSKPEWASAIYRDESGLIAKSDAIAGHTLAFKWQNPTDLEQGYWRTVTVLSESQFPSAEYIGRDQFGFFTDIAIQEITQRMRWIPAGEFLMGSPEDEAERLRSETQHKVTLSQGCWLADTTCTQAIWQAVMQDNPASFKDNPQNPVERVSWDDITNEFLPKFKLLTGIDARLPTEAEWEYACRAGTTTPFNLGGNVTTDQVNYNGNHPYHNGEKGQYREQTVPVKSMNAPNAWGLHEMHGNVYEWCQDWFEYYQEQAQLDPKGPKEGKYRVARGGSWILNGEYARSAFRNFRTPGDRNDFIGFRLAFGQPAAQHASSSQDAKQDR